MFKKTSQYLIYFIYTFTVFTLVSCSGDVEQFDKDKAIYDEKGYRFKQLLKKDGSVLKDLFGGDSKKNSQSIGLSINPHLWKASLDILSNSVPLVSVDSISGMIISDWYNLKNKPNERVKISILVQSEELRADGLVVKVFKQVNSGGNWVNTDINPKLALNLERKIIHKAGLLADQNK